MRLVPLGMVDGGGEVSVVVGTEGMGGWLLLARLPFLLLLCRLVVTVLVVLGGRRRRGRGVEAGRRLKHPFPALRRAGGQCT